MKALGHLRTLFALGMTITLLGARAQGQVASQPQKPPNLAKAAVIPLIVEGKYSYPGKYEPVELLFEQSGDQLVIRDYGGWKFVVTLQQASPSPAVMYFTHNGHEADLKEIGRAQVTISGDTLRFSADSGSRDFTVSGLRFSRRERNCPAWESVRSIMKAGAAGRGYQQAEAFFNEYHLARTSAWECGAPSPALVRELTAGKEYRALDYDFDMFKDRADADHVQAMNTKIAALRIAYEAARAANTGSYSGEVVKAAPAKPQEQPAHPSDRLCGALPAKTAARADQLHRVYFDCLRAIYKRCGTGEGLDGLGIDDNKPGVRECLDANGRYPNANVVVSCGQYREVAHGTYCAAAFKQYLCAADENEKAHEACRRSLVQ